MIKGGEKKGGKSPKGLLDEKEKVKMCRLSQIKATLQPRTGT
jgi:hypothetical protein